MSKKFTVHQESINKGEWYAYPSSIKYGDEVSIRNVPRGIAIKVAELLNIQESTITHLEEEKVELMEDCACQYKQIQKLESENDDLRTTITKQVEAITEMKDIIYMLQGVYVIGEYSSEIEEDMQELKKAYDGNLEDFLNYFKED